ncbi:unnamed protein product [Owenia fusiformis]|uniref:Uncharacterized protein n=1 Tax=Owenia fusiformis TaxID=6347 RepID=A0A8J1U610_OWEFU|nr:unnamed protein product [Owenia fusiformis]
MDDINNLVAQLHIDGEKGTIGPTLDALIEKLTNDDDKEKVDIRQKLYDAKVLPQLLLLLNEEPKLQETVSHLIAELAKAEYARVPCVEAGFIPPLVGLMSTDNVHLSIQVCRALGNICYDNDEGRTEVEKNGGLKKLLDVLTSHISNTQTDADKLRMIACGYLLNLTNCNECMQEKAINLDAVSIMKQYLEQCRNDDAVCHMALMTVASLFDSDFGREKISESGISSTVVDLLEPGNEGEEPVLDLLGTLAEYDKIKVQLTKTTLGEKLMKIIESNIDKDDEDSDALVNAAADLVILILTGDDSMDMWYEDGKALVFTSTMQWLHSNNAHLRVAGALAVGNYARNDSHCIKLVEDSVTIFLLNLLRNHGNQDGVTLQHAIFSALKNLAIPAVNKIIMLQTGIIDTVTPFSKTDMSPVQFKLLGLLRMLVDGQEAASIKVGTNKGLIEEVSQWCNNEDHAGVKGESMRLLAWLVRHSRSSDVMKVITKYGGLSHLVAMTTSEHVVMQNEALVALIIIASSILAEAKEPLSECNVIETVTKLLSDEKTLTEIKENTLTLSAKLQEEGTLKTLMQNNSEFITVISELCNSEESKLRELATTVKSLIAT